MNLVDGLSKADIIVFLVAHDRFKLIDRKLLSSKKVLDFCGVLYEPNTATNEEEIFWPARSMMDFFIANQQHDDIEAA
jgi:UDP-N-acetyl-D-mannosaminuronate dehydrogenase